MSGSSDANGSPPRIVLVLPTYLPESFGGAEQQSRKLALALGRLGLRVALLAPRILQTTPKAEQDGCLSVRRFRVRRPPNLGGRYIGSLLVWSAQLLLWLWRHRGEYDVIHVIHARLHALPAVLAGRLMGKPTLIKIGRGGREHFDLEVVARKRMLGRWYAHTIVNRTSAYVANSREIAEDLRRWQISPSRIHQIPNGVEIPRLDFDRVENETVRFVCLGRLDAEKAVDLTIQGFSRLPADVRATLTIVGDGPCRLDLEQLVNRCGERARISFTGAVQDVTPLLRNADVYVSTSLSEGMSNALLEAMSFGLMPLVSRVSGVVDIVDDGRSGLLFASGDLDAFVAKLEEVLRLSEETRRAFGMAAHIAVRDRFGIDQIAMLHADLYQRLIFTDVG